MASRRKKMTEEERILRFLEQQGFHQVTKEEKKEPWYKEHLKQLERWRKEEMEPASAVRERSATYQ